MAMWKDLLTKGEPGIGLSTGARPVIGSMRNKPPLRSRGAPFAFGVSIRCKGYIHIFQHARARCIARLKQINQSTSHSRLACLGTKSTTFVVWVEASRPIVVILMQKIQHEHRQKVWRVFVASVHSLTRPSCPQSSVSKEAPSPTVP